LHALQSKSGSSYNPPSRRFDLHSPAMALRSFFDEFKRVGLPTDKNWDSNKKLTDAEWDLEVKVISDTIFLSLT